jgi:radical SAM superfamily enzyme
MTEEERKQRRREASKKWRDSNPNHNKKYRQQNKEAIRAVKRKYREANKEKYDAYMQAYRNMDTYLPV